MCVVCIYTNYDEVKIEYRLSLNLKILRNRSFLHFQQSKRVIGPSRIIGNSMEVNLNLTLPSVVLVHVCHSSNAPGRVTNLRVYNITRNEVVITWKDTKVATK